MLVIPAESLELQRVIVNSMSRYTFVIVQPSKYGIENQELASGVGIKWQGAYLILTAGHVVEHCPEDKLRFFLPFREIQLTQQNPSDNRLDGEAGKLMELENPKPPILADDVDLAAILLPPHPDAEDYFFPLEDRAAVPPDRTEVGVFGYPEAARIPVDKNYVALPEYFPAPLNARGDACTHGPIQDFTLPYPLPHRANGYSGSGVWYWLSAPVWSPAAQLIGIITTECGIDSVVSGPDVRSLLAFLNAKKDFILSQ